jgi:hypothetical protein
MDGCVSARQGSPRPKFAVQIMKFAAFLLALPQAALPLPWRAALGYGPSGYRTR